MTGDEYQEKLSEIAMRKFSLKKMYDMYSLSFQYAKDYYKTI